MSTWSTSTTPSGSRRIRPALPLVGSHADRTNPPRLAQWSYHDDAASPRTQPRALSRFKPCLPFSENPRVTTTTSAAYLDQKDNDRWSDEKCKELSSQISSYKNDIIPMAKNHFDGAQKLSNEISDGRLIDHANLANVAIGAGVSMAKASDLVRRAGNTVVNLRLLNRGVELQRYGTALARGLKAGGTVLGIGGLGLELYNFTQADSAKDRTISVFNFTATGYAIRTGNIYASAVAVTYNVADGVAKLFWLFPKQDELGKNLINSATWGLQNAQKSHDAFSADYQKHCTD